MNTFRTLRYVDDILFVLALFVPVSLLMAGSLPLVAIGVI